MNSKFQQYVIEQLAATGFAVMSAGIAYRLRPDIWASRLNCGQDFNEASGRKRQFLEGLPGVKLLEVEIEREWVMLATRSTDDLGRRIEHVTGLTSTGIRPLAEARPVEAQAPRQADEDQPPNYACVAREKWFHDHGIVDTEFRESRRFAPRRAGL